MNDGDHEARRDALAGYLLGALDPGEAAALEQHLAGCDECRTELAWLRPAVQMLPEAVEPLEPPVELRARLMEEVRNDAGKRPAPAWASAGGGWRALLGPAVGLAAVLAIAAGVAGYALRDGGSGVDSTTVSAGHAPGVTAKVVSEGDGGTLRLAHVRALPADEVLQAWVQRGGRIESTKTLFVPDRDGTATVAIDDMRGVDALMVTAEPRGGSEQPTSRPIVSVSMPQ
jgi:anti-sigma-K factor RskA